MFSTYSVSVVYDADARCSALNSSLPAGSIPSRVLVAVPADAESEAALGTDLAFMKRTLTVRRVSTDGNDTRFTLKIVDVPAAGERIV